MWQINNLWKKEKDLSSVNGLFSLYQKDKKAFQNHIKIDRRLTTITSYWLNQALEDASEGNLFFGPDLSFQFAKIDGDIPDEYKTLAKQLFYSAPKKNFEKQSSEYLRIAKTYAKRGDSEYENYLALAQRGARLAGNKIDPKDILNTQNLYDNAKTICELCDEIGIPNTKLISKKKRKYIL